MSGTVEYRDIWPSGVVISEWECEAGREFGNDYSQWGPGMEPAPPWERQRREPGGEWVTVAKVQDEGTDVTVGRHGEILITRTWWE